MQQQYMQLALDLAHESFKKGEMPIGAVIVNYETNQIIAQSGNLVESKCDPTAHAEINTIRMACEKTGNKFLQNADIYVTLEPCPMCAQAISYSKIRRLYFGAYNAKGGGVDNGAQIFNADSCHHIPEIYGGIMEGESANLMQEFFKNKR